jgi:phospholipase A1
MEVAVVIPGIMGSRLHLPDAHGKPDEEVWPPTPREVAMGYHRIKDLQRDDLIVGAPIDNILCFNFYNLLNRHLDGLGFKIGLGRKRRVDFPYDWRRDNFETADRLAARLAELHAEGATVFYLLAHSMGGLVTRLMLEGGKFAAEPWFAKIRLLATLATPHLGAPLALARIFGLDRAMGISGKDFAALAANRAYPSGYQLIPPPGEAAIWNLASSDVATLDPYDPTTASDLGMDPQLIERARAVHELLGQSSQPQHVRYVYFAGSGHRTVTRVNVHHKPGTKIDHTRSEVTRTEAAGDGTVPLYSALPMRGQRQIVVNEHSTVFKGLPFRKVFFRLLGGDAGSPLEALPGVPRPSDTLVQLSLDAPVYAKGEPVELVLALTNPLQDSGITLTTSIQGMLQIQEVSDDEKPLGAAREIPVAYAGPAISGLTLLIAEPLQPGLYSLGFAGTPKAEAPVAFAVQQP